MLLPPVATGRAGAIEPFGSGFAIVTGDGDFFLVETNGAGGDLTARRLPLSLPADPPPAGGPFTERGGDHRVLDFKIDTSRTPARVFVSSQERNVAKDCYTVRVSAADFDATAQASATQKTVWTRVFETSPCLSPTQQGFAYLESGGRLALGNGTLLLTVGDFGLGHNLQGAPSQSVESSYGKVLAISADGRAEVYSLGHRNAQGLLIDRQDRVWLTEHGPQGGDELNLLRRGGNYGYPFVTYGTDYGRTVWMPAPEQRNHGTYIEPVQAFVPSIAISSLIQVQSPAWREWHGDLLIGSLQSQRLYRARIRDDRIVYVEPIYVGVRVRDLAEAADGRIAIWNDAGRLVTLTPAPSTPIGSVVFARCQTCHDSPGADAIAPSLRGIVDAPVARDGKFVYSPAVAKLGGRWTEARLDVFLKNPAAFAPGTIMTAGETPDDQERRVLIEFLKGYR
jgi:cytochrome c2